MQIWPWSTEWSRAMANRVLPREHTGHSKDPLPTTEQKTLHMNITRWSILKSYWLYSLQPKMEKLYTVSENKTGSWLWLRSWTPYYQIQTDLKKVGKTTRPFRYDLNQIPYDYTVEVRNRFKGLDLINRVPDELLTMPKPLTVWITINCGKFRKRWEYQTTWSASWEICMQDRKQQLELDMEQQTGSK